MTVQQDYRTRIPAERFQAAKTYEQYTASIKVNQAKFAANLEGTTVPAGAAERLRQISMPPDGPRRLLVLGEDWCPDVYRGIPIAKKLADAAGWELRILERDQHLDLMEHFKNGEFISIPVFIFLTEDFRVIAHWIERPQLANDQMREALSPIFGPSGQRQLTEKLGREPTDEEKAAARTEAQQRYDAFQATSPIWAGWRDATITEVVELLDTATRQP